MPALILRRLPYPVFLLLVMAALPASAQEGDAAIDELVQEIITLRGDVDELDSRLQSLKKEHENRMSSLAREEGQLASEKERQQLRQKKLQQRLDSERKAIAEAGVEDEALTPVLRDAIAELRGHVETALPFKRGDRLAALDEMDKQLASDSLPPPRVANRLWSFMADEVRLSSETGLYRQPVTIEDQDKLVDVARLGMMHLYFRTDDDRPGYAVREADGWHYRYAEGADRDHIRGLMDSLRKQIRTGYFELPNPEHAGEVTR